MEPPMGAETLHWSLNAEAGHKTLLLRVALRAEEEVPAYLSTQLHKASARLFSQWLPILLYTRGPPL